MKLNLNDTIIAKEIIRRKKHFDENFNDEITHSIENFLKIDYFLYMLIRIFLHLS